MDDNEHHTARIRASAVKTIQFLEESRKSYIDDHGQIGRWIMASLLVLNSGAALSILNRPSVDPIIAIIAGSIFCIGIYFALESGLSSRRAIVSGLANIQRSIAYYMLVEETGKRMPAIEESLDAKITVDDPHSKKTAIYTGLSLFSFFLGIISLGAMLIISDYWKPDLKILPAVFENATKK